MNYSVEQMDSILEGAKAPLLAEITKLNLQVKGIEHQRDSAIAKLDAAIVEGERVNGDRDRLNLQVKEMTDALAEFGVALLTDSHTTISPRVRKYLDALAKFTEKNSGAETRDEVFVHISGMGVGCRVCGRPPGGAGGCKVCQAHWPV